MLGLADDSLDPADDSSEPADDGTTSVVGPVEFMLTGERQR